MKINLDKFIKNIYIININDYINKNPILLDAYNFNQSIGKYNYILLDESNQYISQLLKNNDICKYFISINRYDLVSDYIRLWLLINTDMDIFVDLDMYILDIDNLLKVHSSYTCVAYNKICFDILYKNKNDIQPFVNMLDWITNNYYSYFSDFYIPLSCIKITEPIDLKYRSMGYNSYSNGRTRNINVKDYNKNEKYVEDIRILIENKPLTINNVKKALNCYEHSFIFLTKDRII